MTSDFALFLWTPHLLDYPMITILTATYNRAHELSNLYQSLVNQTSKNFEWLVVDDGSDDETNELVNNFVNENLVNVRYIRKANGGKHTALNVGFSDRKTRSWIFVVDSDDSIASNCVEVVLKEIDSLPSNYVAIRMLQINRAETKSGQNFPTHYNNYFDFINSSLSNDNADIFRKSALNGFRFPIFEGEKFMAESPLFIWLGNKGYTKYINYKGYVAEYLPGGLSEKSVVNRHKCFNSALYVYENKYRTSGIKILGRVSSGINWWRFRLFKGKPTRSFSAPKALLPFGLMLYLRDVFRKNV